MRFFIEWALALVAFWTTRNEAFNQVYFLLGLFLTGRIAQVRIWKLTDFVLGSIVLGYALFNRGLDVGFDETITFAVSRLFWRYGLRNYSGASA